MKEAFETRLSELVSNGFSASKIAVALNKDFKTKHTRSSVIGLCNRRELKLKGYEPNLNSIKNAQIERLPIANIDNIRTNQCRYIIGEPKPHFCERDLVRGVYCAEHASKCYIGGEKNAIIA